MTTKQNKNKCLLAVIHKLQHIKIRSCGLTANNENIPHIDQQTRKVTTMSMLSKDLTERHTVKSPRDNWQQNWSQYQ